MPKPDYLGRTLINIDASSFARYFALWGWLTGGLNFLKHWQPNWGIVVSMLILISWIVFGIVANWIFAYVLCSLVNFNLMLVGGVTFYTKEVESVNDASTRVRQMMRDPE